MIKLHMPNLRWIPNIKSCYLKVTAVITQWFVLAMVCAPKAFADDVVDIGTGLNTVNNSTLAGKILAIATGVGSLAGVVGVGFLIANAAKLGGKERAREEGKEGIMWTLIGLAVVGLASIIVGFIAYFVKNGSGGA